MEYLEIYNKARVVPEDAQKTITAGRLKGFTDINPMWRIKKLTELFGPCGLGWWYTVDRKEIIHDTQTNQSAAFVDITLYYTFNGEVSKGIPGTGGSGFVSQEKNGPRMSDECFKMALTDAISVAAKALGIGADIYWGADRSKYSNPNEEDTPFKPAKKGKKKEEEEPIICSDCGAVLTGYTGKDGVQYSAREQERYTVNSFGRTLCLSCWKKATEEKRQDYGNSTHAYDSDLAT